MLKLKITQRCGAGYVTGVTGHKGVELKLVRGGKNFLGWVRENFPSERFFPLLGMIFASLRAYFFNFSLYIVRMAKSSGGGASPPEKLQGNFSSPPPVLRL